MSKPIEAVEVLWHDFPDRVYVRGHWPADDPRAEEALEVARAEFERQAELHGLVDDLPEGEEWPCPQVGIRKLLWARWVPTQGGDWEMGFHTQHHAAPGAFPVTEVLDLDEQARQQARQAERQKQEAELEAKIRSLYPEATRIKAQLYSPGHGRVAFWMPALEGAVLFNEHDSGFVLVERRDLEAWSRLYAGRAAAGGAR